MKKFNIYLGIFIILIGLSVNEWTLRMFSHDAHFHPMSIQCIRFFNASFVIVGLMSILWKYIVILLPKSKLGRTVLFYIGFFIFLEIFARVVLFYYDPGNFFHNKLYCENWARIVTISNRLHNDPEGIIDTSHHLRGWTLKSNIKDFLYAPNFLLNSNSKGIRGAVEYLYEKPNDQFRIVAIGDSFTFGEEANDEETYPHYLSKLLPKTEVINLGVEGYGHDQILLYLQEEGVKYHPDIVLLGFVRDDMRRNTLGYTHFQKPRYILKNGQLHLTNTPIPTPQELINREFYRLKLLDILSPVLHRIKTLLIKEPSESEISEALLDEIHKIVQSIGADLYMVYLPTPQELDVDHEGLKKGEKFFNDYCREKQIRCLSLKPYFENLMLKGEKLKKVGHWDAKGYYLIAKGIADYLLSENDIKILLKKKNKNEHE